MVGPDIKLEILYIDDWWFHEVEEEEGGEMEIDILREIPTFRGIDKEQPETLSSETRWNLGATWGEGKREHVHFWLFHKVFHSSYKLCYILIDQMT